MLVVAVLAASRVTGEPLSQFTRDPSMLAGAHPFLGILSNIGILLWTATAAISLFTAMLLYRTTLEIERRSLLLAAGLLTAWLTLDDFFLFHEWLFPTVLGVPQPIVYVAYLAVFGMFLYRFGGRILRTDYLLFAVALGCFALSVATDALPDEWFAWDYLSLVEDGSKFLGIVSWFGYFGDLCADTLAGWQS
jgi:hypothetical protein